MEHVYEQEVLYKRKKKLQLLNANREIVNFTCVSVMGFRNELNDISEECRKREHEESPLLIYLSKSE